MTPDAASLDAPETGALLPKYYRVGRFGADDRRRLVAQSPAFACLLHVDNTYDFAGPFDFVRRSCQAVVAGGGGVRRARPSPRAGVSRARRPAWLVEVTAVAVLP